MSCQFCQHRRSGDGKCLYCEGESRKAYDRIFGPKPIATFNLNDPADIEKAKAIIGREALEKAFGPGGGGVQEIADNFRKASNT